MPVLSHPEKGTEREIEFDQAGLFSGCIYYSTVYCIELHPQKCTNFKSTLSSTESIVFLTNNKKNNVSSQIKGKITFRFLDLIFLVICEEYFIFLFICEEWPPLA